ncbi:hypothetical protein KL941_002541 [Ogataea angusta]|nr:hypothetical protein KL941_002541 [Ogataea angusta]
MFCYHESPLAPHLAPNGWLAVQRRDHLGLSALRRATLTPEYKKGPVSPVVSMDRRMLIIGTPGVPPSGSSLFITDDTLKPFVWEDSVFLALESKRSTFGTMR